MLTVEAGLIDAEDTGRADAPTRRQRGEPLHLTGLVVVNYSQSVKAVAYSRTAQKALIRMPRKWARRIRDKIRAYAEDPAAQANNVTALKGQGGLIRLRVGDWRVIMRDEAVLTILSVSSRGDAYKE